MQEGTEMQESAGLGEIEPRRIVTDDLAHSSHLHALLQNLGEGIVFLDQSLCILYVNPAGAALLQRPAEDLVGTALSSILRDGKKDPLIRSLETLASCEGVATERSVYQHGDQTFHLTLTNVLADGQVAGLLLLIRDASTPVRRIEELAALNELGTLLTSTLNPREVFRLIMDRIQGLMGVEASSLLLKDEQKDELVFQIGLGEQGASLEGRRLKLGQGIVGWVFQHGTSLIVPDVAQDERFHQRMDTETGFQTKSVLCVPLKTRGKVIGVIQVLNRPTDRAFTEEDLNLLSAIAAHAATAIENARLFQETQTRAKKLAALAAVSQALTATLDLQQVFELIVRAGSKLLDSSVASLWTLEGDEPILRTGWGLDSELWDQDVRLIEGLVTWIARQKQPMVINQFAEDPRGENTTGAHGDGTHTCAGFPLHVEKRYLGVLTVLRTSPQPFTQDEVDLLSSFANQAAIVVDHAILHHELLARSANLERIVRDRTKAFRQKTQELERDNRTRSEYFHTLCHELKKSLGSVVAFSQLLQQQPAGDPTEKQATYVANILDGAQHLLALINNMLDITRMDAGKLELHREVIQVTEVLVDVLADIRPHTEAKGLQLAVDVKECHSALVADPLRVRQILYNLLSNAVMLTPEGGRITVEARSHGEAVELSVSDTGIGIMAEDIPRLFEPFSHLDPASSKEVLIAAAHHQGTGLGLALSKHLVDLHGGTIRAESGGAGQGSTFTITLPSVAPSRPSP